MSLKGKIFSALAFLSLAVVVTLVGVWAVTGFDFVVGGNITYTAPVLEVKDQGEYPYLSFSVTDGTNKTASVTNGIESQCPSELVIPAKVKIDEVEYSVTNIPHSYYESGVNFQWWTKIKSLTLPSTMKVVGDYAFYDCRYLTSVTLPEGVEVIGNNAFGGCGLTELVLPSTIVSMGRSAFSCCSSLQNVYVKATDVATGGAWMFDGCLALENIFVPRESVEAYKSASGWSDYADYIVGYDF